MSWINADFFVLILILFGWVIYLSVIPLLVSLVVYHILKKKNEKAGLIAKTIFTIIIFIELIILGIITGSILR